MKKHLHILFLSLLGLDLVTAQEMPSSSASGPIDQVNTPVNLFSGIATVNVPVYTITQNNGATVPISLVYETEAIKVNEIAPPAGLGWQLSGGGAITRIVRGEPDEQAQYAETATYASVRDAAIDDNGNYDFEKDLYYYSFPGGAGRFVFGSGGTIEFLPSNDLDIQYYYNGSLSSYFVITDLMGNQYTFGSSSDARETTTSTSIVDGNGATQRTEQFISTWHLEEISYANLPASENVTFTYSKNGITTTSQSATLFGREDTNPQVGYTYIDQPPTVTATTTTIAVCKPESISFSKGTVHFDYWIRKDVTTGARLMKIRVNDGSQNVHTVELGHVYSNASGSIQMNNTTCGRPECYRLMLKSVAVNGFIVRSFDYINEEIKYGVDQYELPPRDSYYVNAGGYYYTGRPNELLPYSTTAGGTGSTGTLSGAPPNLDGTTLQAQANLLRKVHYPTGGYTEFAYAATDPVTSKKAVKGVMVVSIENKIGADLIAGKQYQYQNPHDFPVTSYAYRYPNKAAIWFSHSVSDVFDLNPREGYRSVKVTDSKTGASTATEFYIWEPTNSGGGLFPGTISGSRNQIVNAPEKFIYYLTVSTQQINERSEDAALYPTVAEPPYSSYPLLDYRIGLPRVESVYDENGVITASTEYVYEHGPETRRIPNRVFFRGLSGEPWEGTGGKFVGYWYKILAAEYDISCKTMYLDRTISTSYDESGSEISQVTSQFSYHPTYASLQDEVLTYRSSADEAEAFNSKQLVFYPMDTYFDPVFPTESQAVLDQMVTNSMIARPVFTEQQVHLPEYGQDAGQNDIYKASGATMTVYKAFDNLIQPHQTYSLQLSEPMMGKATDGNGELRLMNTVTYNDQGLVTTSVGTDNIITSYSYDGKGYLIGKSVDPGDPEMARTTSYSYNMVGLQSTTDPSGFTSTYEYDSRNRLEVIRDQDGNIVKRYTYNAPNEEEFCLLEIDQDSWTTTGGTKVFKYYSADPVTFTPNQGWIRVISTTSDTFTVRVDPGATQNSTISISAGGCYETLGISRTATSGGGDNDGGGGGGDCGGGCPPMYECVGGVCRPM